MEVYALQVRPKDHPFPILAWLIMLLQGMNPFSKKAYSHNAIMFKGLDGKFLVIDSTSKSVRIQSDISSFKHYKFISQKKMPRPKDELSFILWLQNILGREYDKLQIFGLLLKMLHLISFNKMGADYNKMTCNEVILNYLEYHCDFYFGDPDNFDLIRTWEIIP